MKRRRRSRQTDNSCGRGQSPVHSAHVGQEVEVRYRWHPLYGRRVRRHYSEQRAAGPVVHVEAMPGVVTAIAAWMLDPVACAGMATIGAPRVTVSALLELHHLLIERGFRRSSRDDHTIVQGEQYAETARAGPIVHGPAPTQHDARFGEAARYEPLRTQHRAYSTGQSVVGGGRRRSGGV
jgi:hypothetical protein